MPLQNLVFYWLKQIPVVFRGVVTAGDILDQIGGAFDPLCVGIVIREVADHVECTAAHNHVGYALAEIVADEFVFAALHREVGAVAAI